MQYKSYKDLSLMSIDETNSFISTDRNGELNKTETDTLLNGLAKQQDVDIPTYYISKTRDYDAHPDHEWNRAAYSTREACVTDNPEAPGAILVGDLAKKWTQGEQFNICLVFYYSGETDNYFYDESYDQFGTVIGVVEDTIDWHEYDLESTRLGLIILFSARYAATDADYYLTTFTDYYNEQSN